jgi:hypothetical protein
LGQKIEKLQNSAQLGMGGMDGAMQNMNDGVAVGIMGE